MSSNDEYQTKSFWDEQMKQAKKDFFNKMEFFVYEKSPTAENDNINFFNLYASAEQRLRHLLHITKA